LGKLDSVTTKRAIAASLKKLLKKKSLDSVTISDIAEGCGVNRQTFPRECREGKGAQGCLGNRHRRNAQTL